MTRGTDNPRTCFITGGNSGIGREAALQLARAGFRVAIGCRNRSRGETALSELVQASPGGHGELVVVDLSSMASVRAAAGRVEELFGALDVLIHNAADFDMTRKNPLISPDRIETIWAANHIGPVLLTELLVESLKKSAQGRIITVASRGLTLHPLLKVNLDDPEYRKRRFTVARAYYQSKMAQLMYTYHLAGELEDSGVTVNCVRVTNVKIDMNRYPEITGFRKYLYSIKSRFSISPGQMARTYTWLATSSRLNRITGGYFDEKNSEIRSSKYSRNPDEIRRVMDLTQTYISLLET